MWIYKFESESEICDSFHDGQMIIWWGPYCKWIFNTQRWCYPCHQGTDALSHFGYILGAGNSLVYHRDNSQPDFDDKQCYQRDCFSVCFPSFRIWTCEVLFLLIFSARMIEKLKLVRNLWLLAHTMKDGIWNWNSVDSSQYLTAHSIQSWELKSRARLRIATVSYCVRCTK